MAKNPVSQLKELADKKKWLEPTYDTERDPLSPDHHCMYITTVYVNGCEFVGEIASSKKVSKTNAAIKALNKLSKGNVKSSQLQKDPVSTLNESGFTIEYTEFNQSGPPHRPTFRIAAVVGGYFCGYRSDSTKTDAKKCAAKSALFLIENGKLEQQQLYKKNPTDRPQSNQKKDIISHLEEYCKPRGICYHANVFKTQKISKYGKWNCKTNIDGKWYPVRQGTTIDEAKKMSSKVAFDMFLRKKFEILAHANEKARETFSWHGPDQSPDLIQRLVLAVYRICHETLKENFTSQKVLAAFVMKKSPDDLGEVVTLATGNRTILGDHVTTNGEKLIDCHAEIMAGRSLKRYFYNQLKLFSVGDNSSIFELSHDRKLSLKLGITFHLYISRPPCGDASEFQSIEADGIKSKHSRKQGLLRTKIERGEGTIPTSNTDNDRLKVHSCSDKICRWNVLGLQGSLLNLIMKPVYLRSIVIGSYRNAQILHFRRAFYSRLDGTAIDYSLPTNFLRNKCDVFTTANSFDNEDMYSSKSSKFSINWCVGDSNVETVDGTLGTVAGSSVRDFTSRLSKRKLFEYFLDVMKALDVPNNVREFKTYGQTKLMCKDYQKAKYALMEAFQNAGCDSWISFGRNVDEFRM